MSGGKFYWPPRPEKAIHSDMIEFYESRGWIAQKKMNGSCTVISIDANGNVAYWNRHNELHRAWTAPSHVTEYFSRFRDTVFVGELLHNKSKAVKNHLYLFDMIRADGDFLYGECYRDRMARLDKLIVPSNSVSVAHCYESGFVDLFNDLDGDIEEGLVFKNPDAALKPCFKNGLNTGWQTKVRKTTKNYAF